MTIAALFALAAALSVAGCGKESPAPAEKAAQAPAQGAAETPASGLPAGLPHPVPAEPTDDVDLSGIARAEGGTTVAEVFAEKDQLAGQSIVFRGKVVKVNANIMGKNWLHVRDGSGVEGTNDLTVTTNDILPEIGDTVLVSGVVAVNKDFGMGYKYDILIEDAEVTIE